MTFLIVTGTDTEVGKTVVTAAIAALAVADGQRVAVVKPAQTGVAAEGPGDIDVVRALSGVDDVHELVRYRLPLAPATAARAAGTTPMLIESMSQRIGALSDRDLVLVEGSGGLLVHLDGHGGTLVDIARRLAAPVLIVARAGLGTLNAVALTADVLATRGLTCKGVVIGAWPASPDLAAEHNLDDLPAYANAPLLGAVPAGAGVSPARDRFLRIARVSIAPALGGTWVRRPVG